MNSFGGGPQLGTPRWHLRVTDSTNLRARELARAGAPHGTLVTAGEQQAGRGRQGRTWTVPAGHGLLGSLVIRSPDRLLSLRAGLAVADVCGDGAVVKWPNDVLVDGRKLAGILVEGRPQDDWAVLGIGLNVAVRPADLPPELRDVAGTLGLEPEDVEPTLARLLVALQRWLAAQEEAVRTGFAARDVLAGQLVRWADGEGRADGIDASGGLRVTCDDGRQMVLSAGEVHLVAAGG